MMPLPAKRELAGAISKKISIIVLIKKYNQTTFSD